MYKKKRETAKICFNYPHFWIRKISLGLHSGVEKSGPSC